MAATSLAISCCNSSCCSSCSCWYSDFFWNEPSTGSTSDTLFYISVFSIFYDSKKISLRLFGFLLMSNTCIFVLEAGRSDAAADVLLEGCSTSSHDTFGREKKFLFLGSCGGAGSLFQGMSPPGQQCASLKQTKRRRQWAAFKWAACIVGTQTGIAGETGQNHGLSVQTPVAISC